MSSRRREASEGLRRRLARSEICLDKVTPAAVWRMNYKGVKSGSKKSRMGQIRDRRRCPKGTSKRSSQKAKQKSPAPWWTKALWRPGQAPGETPRRVRMGEGRSRAGAGSGPLLSDWNGKVGRDKGAPQGHTASLSSAGMWGFLGVREEIA